MGRPAVKQRQQEGASDGCEGEERSRKLVSRRVLMLQAKHSVPDLGYSMQEYLRWWFRQGDSRLRSNRGNEMKIDS